jgi:hypothetical protein
MRKLLLATTATVSGLLGLATVAQAQVKLNDGTTLVTPFTAGGGIGSQTPQPGNIVFHFDGRFAFTANGYFDQKANYSPTSAQALGNPAGSEKLGVVGFTSNTRLQPGFDGVAANGLQYGAYVELRDDQKTANIAGNYATTASTPASLNSTAFSAYTGTTNSDIQQRTRGTFYLYSDFGYIGSKYGIVKVGQQSTSSAMFLTGTMENFADGGWHGTQGTAQQLNNGWYSVNNSISAGRLSIQYLSPQIYGFDASFTFAPNENSETQWSGCTLGVAGPGCNELTTSTDPNSWGRTVNWIDVALRYRGTFGPVGLAVEGGGIYAGTVKPGFGSAAATPFNRFKPVEQFLGGAQVSYGGLLTGAHIEVGNTDYQQQPEFKGTKPAISYIGGASYTIGALTFGAQYLYALNSQHISSTFVHNQVAQGPFVGAQYILAPGLLVYAGYNYAMLRQIGFNFVTNTAATSAATLVHNNGLGGLDNNKVSSQIATLGAIFSW